jgi:hypothetical protein
MARTRESLKPGRQPSGKGGASIIETYPAFTVRLPPDADTGSELTR